MSDIFPDFSTVNVVIIIPATSASLFLLHRHSSIPASYCFTSSSCSCRCVAVNSTPLAPSSPHTPFHSVLSQSSAITLYCGLTSAAKDRSFCFGKRRIGNKLFGCPSPGCCPVNPITCAMRPRRASWERSAAAS